MKNHLSPADAMWCFRLRATNVADMKPATPATTHLTISQGTRDRHCKQVIIDLSMDPNGKLKNDSERIHQATAFPKVQQSILQLNKLTNAGMKTKRE